ncbi:uncharacterized protein C3orf20-like isoform X1 [Simochromis diagramma]|uniref:uncharacterized protein C3orf20-like isoform X1 n=1 Tax=Simochromis diagramma TaxID=43689 RepID=UPI001A7EFDDD|nr:uncharacterized protein C3orf20-like isoform X1 [Simochromis diagramma]
MSYSGGTEGRRGPFYFFDQPAGRNRVKGERGNILHLSVINGGAQFEGRIRSNLEENEGREEEGDKPGTASALTLNGSIEAYKQAAPQLLNELARLLWQHRWADERRLPHGVVNILNCSWHDLTAGALRSSPKLTDKLPKSVGSPKLQQPPRQVSASGREETTEENPCAAGSAGFTGRKSRAKLNPHVKKSEPRCSRARSSTAATPSISSSLIAQPNQASSDVLNRISLYQWVVERLQGAKDPEKLPTTELDPNEQLILRHYGDTKANVTRRRRKDHPSSLVNGMPQIPEMKQQDPARQKLHYRINDGSSFIHYPSGCMAVCQSHSGLPCGGFYTNVFTDSNFPTILATITAFGRGAVTHPLSSAVTALWDQNGGFMCDIYGNKTKEWSWKTYHREKIAIQISDHVSVSLSSGTSAVLTFRCENETAQLPLSARSHLNQPKETSYLKTRETFISDAAQDLLYPPLTHKSVCSRDALQMVREGKRQEESSAHWKRGGHPSGTLIRLQQRVHKTVEDWLDCYRVAVGIKCPGSKRMPDAPPRTRPRKEAQSAALPSVKLPERVNANPVQLEDSRDEFRELHGHLSQSAERAPDFPVVLPRTPKKPEKKERGFTQLGPLRIYGSIKPESVFLPNNPELQMSAVTLLPAVAPFPPSVPLTVCPDLLRAALLGEGQRRSCCCSTKLMPVVTDLEYDALIMGQPPQSQQILVVCVTCPRQPVDTHATLGQDSLEYLYRRKNKHRTSPCTQCQMDSFRVVRYEIEMENPCYESKNILLRQRHRAAPGTVLMYIRGKLLFAGYICSDHSFSARVLEKQISRSRRDYRLGLILPSDYKFSDSVNTPAAADTALT